MSGTLTGWLHGTRVCEISPRGDGVSMTFHPDALDRWGPGSRVLSL